MFAFEWNIRQYIGEKKALDAANGQPKPKEAPQSSHAARQRWQAYISIWRTKPKIGARNKRQSPSYKKGQQWVCPCWLPISAGAVESAPNGGLAKQRLQGPGLPFFSASMP
jgi:hypothetical protein